MPSQKSSGSKADLLWRAVSRWDNEGGLVAALPVALAASTTGLSGEPRLTNTEIGHLRARIVALESVIVATLATASEGQLTRVREMAKLISPRPDSTQHPVTKDACLQILSLVERAAQLEDRSSPAP